MKGKLLFILIILVAAVLRIWMLGQTPVSLDWDEAALGYNAYSILQTGKDEYGEFLPLTMRSFGDFKPALYVYMIIPFIYSTGLTDVAVRFPSAIFGIIAVIATYFFVKELLLFAENEKKSKGGLVLTYRTQAALPFLSAGLLAISPWHIQFSRVAFEANVAVTLNLLGVLFFFVGLRKHWYFPLSVFFLGSGLYMYQSEKVFVPLLVVLLFVLFIKKILQSVPKSILAVTVVVGVLTILPFGLSILMHPDTLSRAKGVSIFSHMYPQVTEAYERVTVHHKNGEFVGLLFDNTRVEYVKILIHNYLAHFNPNWLFITGDVIARHHAPSMGNLYIWEFPFILIGMYTLIVSALARRIKLFIFGWLLLVPIPVAISWDVPSSVRTLNFLPLFQIFTAFGIVAMFHYLNSSVFSRIRYSVAKIAVYGFVLSIGVFSFVYYLNQYFSQYNYYSSKDWQYGYDQAISFLEEHKNEYDKIVVSNQSPLDQSYIFFLYYLRYSPEEYQKVSTVGDIKKFDKYVFKPIEFGKDEGKVLYVGREKDFSDEVTPLHTIHYLDGETAIQIVAKP